MLVADLPPPLMADDLDLEILRLGQPGKAAVGGEAGDDEHRQDDDRDAYCTADYAAEATLNPGFGVGLGRTASGTTPHDGPDQGRDDEQVDDAAHPGEEPEKVEDPRGSRARGIEGRLQCRVHPVPWLAGGTLDGTGVCGGRLCSEGCGVMSSLRPGATSLRARPPSART